MTKETKKKLSDKEREKAEIVVWFDRIERGKKLRTKKLKEVKKFIQYYKNNQWAEITGYKEKPTINMIFAYIKSQIPFLYFQNPKWYVKPKPGHAVDAVDNSETATILLNYYVNENLRITLKKQMRLAILDAYFFFGVAKTGYTPELMLNENYGKPKILGYKDEAAIYDIDDVTGEAKVDTQEELVVSDKFASRRLSPACMIFDTECQNYFDDGRYIIEEISLPLEDVKNDSRYEHTEDLKPSYSIKHSLGLTKDDESKSEYKELFDDLKRITIYEIYDLEHDKLKVVAEGEKNYFLRNEKTPDGIDGHPYSFLTYNDIPDELYPLSDLRILKSSQEEINKSQSLINSHAKRYGRKFAYMENLIDEAEMTKLESGEDGVFFKVKELPLNKAIELLPTAPLDAAVGAYQTTSKMNFDKLSASTEADRGAVERRKTATEARDMSQKGDLRKEDRRSQVEDFAADIGMKLLKSMQANLTVDDAIKIGGEGAAKNWIQIKDREQINGEFNVGVIVGSMTPKLPEYERADFAQFMQTLSLFPAELVQVKVNFDSILKASSKMFPSLEDIQLLNDDATQKKIQEQIQQKQKVEQLIELAKIQGKRTVAQQKGVKK